jgi:ribosomal protein L11 methyltransferase
VQARDWSESWKRHFKPIEIGRSLLVKPTWSNRVPKSGQQLVLLDPGLSFGTGQHATTHFCLTQVAKLRRAGERQSFMDMGTGSGILAIAAAKLGYAPVKAFDFDPDAVRISAENTELNGVTGAVELTQADLTKMPRGSKEKFDVVCANLIYDLLIAERDRILARLAPDGSLVLAGILATQFKAVEKAFAGAGLKLVTAKTDKEWRSGLFRSDR